MSRRHLNHQMYTFVCVCVCVRVCVGIYIYIYIYVVNLKVFIVAIRSFTLYTIIRQLTRSRFEYSIYRAYDVMDGNVDHVSLSASRGFGCSHKIYFRGDTLTLIRFFCLKEFLCNNNNNNNLEFILRMFHREMLTCALQWLQY